MAKKKRSFPRFLLGTLFALGFMILFLELGSRWYREPDQNVPDYVWVVCDLDRYPRDEGKLLVIQELVGKKARGEKITREDLDRALISAPQDQMPGLNGIVCNQMIFVGLSDSWEQFYQAVRRCWRYGQQKEVHVHIVSSDIEGAVLTNIKRKESQNKELKAEMIEIMKNKTLLEMGKATREKTQYLNTIEMEQPKWAM